MDSIIPSGRVGRLLAFLCFVACVAVADAESFSHTSPSSTGTNGGNSRAGRRTYIRVEGTPSPDIQIYVEGQSISTPGWRTVNVVNNHGSREDYYQWSNNASTNSTGLPAKTAGINSTVQWRKGTNGQIQTVPVNIAPDEGTVTYGGGGSFRWFDLPPTILKFDGDELEDIEVPNEEKEYREGWILIDNQTGEPKNIKFGDETITAQPGVNVYDFYGEVDPNTGLPKAFPPGFIGEVVRGPDGQNYFGGRLGFHSEGGIEWKPFPFTISPPPSSNQGPILNTGGTQYQLPPGMTPGSNLPLPPGMTPGGNVPLPNGVGHGGTGNGPNPNVPSGSNGSLPNGVISGGSNHLPSGVSPGVVSNPNGSQTGTGNMGGGQSATDNEPTADGNWDGGDPVMPEGKHDLASKVTGLRGALIDKFEGLVPNFGNGGLPRTNVFSVSFPAGSWGDFDQQLDFGQTPFPQIRMMLLVFLTATTAVAFFKKLTI